jgi:hypothetical protein
VLQAVPDGGFSVDFAGGVVGQDLLVVLGTHGVSPPFIAIFGKSYLPI